ncbi:hypothetical protein HYH03_008363 [Edaphochlamys debaryana]|uniref:Peptidase M11 gametolysin domain-containing protein n=1 Tax=Edaphochlamys debaryana TaxID=47281 RepID=A0A835Y9M1_9CHLO|nr:hypothetical protein HYH03_008363 [Edaphochlamys debaryana]|eukprot:KAG2493549.1 hypothetical protein HYH03_008363 [Edaphochlamys debaryana]
MALLAPRRLVVAAAFVLAACLVSSAWAQAPGSPDASPSPEDEPPLQKVQVEASLYYGSAFRWIRAPPPHKRRPPPVRRTVSPSPEETFDDPPSMPGESSPPPPEFPSPPPSPPDEWAGYSHTNGESIPYAYLRTGCPLKVDQAATDKKFAEIRAAGGNPVMPDDAVYVDDPEKCADVPIATIATGPRASLIQQAGQFLNGDNVKLSLKETAVGARRRRALREGRSLLQDDDLDPEAPTWELDIPGHDDSTVDGYLANIVDTNKANVEAGKDDKISIDADAFALKRPGSQKEIYKGAPISLTTIVFVLDFSSASSSCGSASSWGAQVKADDVRKAMVDGSYANNLKNFYETCSYGKSKLAAENVTVLGPVPIPCKGYVFKNFTGRPIMPPRPPPKPPSQWANLLPLSRKNDTIDDWWDISRYCTASEQQAWEREAEKWARNEALKDPNLARLLAVRERRRNIYVLPNALTCQWAGYADVTCTSPTCSVYVKGGVSGTGLQVFTHEAMHNYGLEHAGMGMDEYGDSTDVMGNFRQAANGLLCPNAPNMYRIGWAKPLNPPGTPATPISSPTPKGGQYGSLSAGNFTPASASDTLSRGNKRTFTLPAFSSRDDNHLMIALGAQFTPVTAPLDPTTGASLYTSSTANPKIPFPVYYISYRVKNFTPGGFDSGITSSYDKKVLIHQYNGTQSERTFGFKSLLWDWGPSFNRRASWDSSGNTWASPFVAVQKIGNLDLGGGLVIRVIPGTATTTSVQVEVCRQYAQKETADGCRSGADLDCDGLIGSKDPDCPSG